MYMKNILFALAVVLLLTTCSGSGFNEDSDITEAVDSFATAYFNYDFKAASRHCTAESVKWLRYAATNVIDEDIELLRAQSEGATHEVVVVNRATDTTATASIAVRNFLQRDTLGRPGHIVSQGLFSVNLAYRSGRWLVDAPISVNRK